MAVASLSPKRSARLTKGERHNLMMGLLFVSPWLLGFLIWTLYPLISSIFFSFTRYDFITPMKFIGFQNYVEIFTRDPRFYTVVYNTFYYVGIGVPLGVGVSVGVSVSERVAVGVKVGPALPILTSTR